MKCLLFLFSGLLIACSNPALAQTNCPQTGTGTGTGSLSAISTAASSMVSEISGLASSLFGMIPVGMSAAMMPLQTTLTMAEFIIPTILSSVQGIVSAFSGVANTLTLPLTSIVNLLSGVVPMMNSMANQTSSAVAQCQWLDPPPEPDLRPSIQYLILEQLSLLLLFLLGLTFFRLPLELEPVSHHH